MSLLWARVASWLEGDEWEAPFDRAKSQFVVRHAQTGEPPTHQYRWMHHGEFTQAEQEGRFQPYINTSPGKSHDLYAAADSMLVRFPHDDDTFEGKDTTNGTAARARTSIPFGQAEVVKKRPQVPEHVAPDAPYERPNIYR